MTVFRMVTSTYCDFGGKGSATADAIRTSITVAIKHGLMKRWQVHFLGASQLPDDISGFEIAHFFSFNAELRKAIKARRTDCLRLALAVHVGFLRLSGSSLDAFERIPAPLLRHLKKHLGVRAPDLATLRSLYRRRATLYEHQEWAAAKLGLKAFTPHRQGALVRSVREEAQQTITVDGLVQFARCWLYDNSILIPGDRRLKDVCRRALADAEKALLDTISAVVSVHKRRRWMRALSEAHEAQNGSRMEWLQQPPRRRSPKGLVEVVEKIQYLESMGVAKFILDDVRLERQQAYASRMRRRRPSRFQQLQEPRRSIELVCWLRVVLMQLTDVALALGGMQSTAVERRAREEVEAENAELTEVLREHIVEACSIGEDTGLTDREARERMLAALDPARIPLASGAARLRQRLSANARRTRPLLKTLLKLPLQHAPDEPVGQAIETLRSLYASNTSSLPDTVDAAFAPGWSDVIHDQDRRRAFRGYEAALMQALKADVKRGAVWVDHSLNHRDRDHTLMPKGHWSRQRRTLLASLQVSTNAERHLQPVCANLEVALEELARSVDSGDVQIVDGELRLPALEAEKPPSDVDHARRQLFSDVGTVEWPELITAMDSRVRFSWTLLGRAPNSEKELLAVYGALLAHGTELSAAAVSMTIPGVTTAAVTQAMHLLENASALGRANQQVVDFLQCHAVTKAWGRGTTASSDAMSLEASRHLWNARVDPRHRRYAIGLYTHVLDQWGIIYDQPVVLNQRQAGLAIEGVVRQKASTELQHLAVDTHGFTDFAMAVSKLLGFDLCPRLKNLKQRRLHLPTGFTIPTSIRAAAKRDVRVDDIRDGWDGLGRVVASIDGGWTSGTLALERFGSASRRDPIFKAGTNLGKLYRTLFLCDYFTNPSFRRELLRILNHGESVHALQRAIYFGGLGVSRGRRHDELVAISGSLSLLCNLAMAWMTNKLQAVLDDRERAGRSVPDVAVLRHIGPVHSEGINFRGRFHFPIRAYASRILSAA